MFKEDLYDLLGVKRDANETEIKKAYRKKSKEHHPDVGGDDEMFKKIAYAYDILSNPQKRDLYNKYGHDMGRSQGGSMTPDMEEFIRQAQEEFMAGFGMRREYVQQVRLNIQVGIKEIYTGTTKKYKYKVNRSCSKCNGLKYNPSEGGSIQKCNICGGSGMVTQKNGFMVFSSTCPSCGGAGSSIQNGCKQCNLTGYEKIEQTVEIEIPKGTPNGAHMVMSGKGNEEIINNKSFYGDLVVFINTINENGFVRENNDLHSTIKIPIVDAMLGCEIKVKTIDDKDIAFKIPTGVEYGQKFRLIGKGMPIYNTNNYGDMYIHVEYKIKNKLSDKEKELLNQLKELQTTNE